MPFESGNVSMRLFWFRDPMTEEIIEKFKEHLPPPIELAGSTPINGWISWRHLLDRDISLENCYFQPWLYLTLVKIEKKIPSALLKAYCKIEEEAEKKSRGLEFLPRKIKAEIKKRVTDALLPEMPPTLTGINKVTNLSSNLIFSDATSKKAFEAFIKNYREATNHEPIALSPTNLALLRKQVNVNDLEATVFTDNEHIDKPENCSLGLEFLTWLWWSLDSNRSEQTSKIGEKFNYGLDGPVTFYNEVNSAHNVVISDGLPLLSKEAGSALYCGKMVSKIKLRLSDSEKFWECMVDQDFCFKKLKLPQGEEKGTPTFQERMESIEKFTDLFLQIFDRFLEERVDAKKWEDVVHAMRTWTKYRSETDDGDYVKHENVKKD